MVKLFHCLIISLFVMFLFCCSVNFVFAESVLPGTGTVTKASCGNCTGAAATASEACKQLCGAYQLNDIIGRLIQVTDILLGVVGSLTLAFLVYGGVMFLISGGNKERVEKGKTIIQNAVIGLVLVFVAWTIIGFVFFALGVNLGSTSWARIGWFNPGNTPSTPATDASVDEDWSLFFDGG